MNNKEDNPGRGFRKGGRGKREREKVIINPSINVISMIAFDLIPGIKIEQIKRLCTRTRSVTHAGGAACQHTSPLFDVEFPRGHLSAAALAPG